MQRRDILRATVALALTPAVAIAKPSFDIAKAAKLYCDIVEKDMIDRIRGKVDEKLLSKLTMRKEYYMQLYAIPLHKQYVQ